MFFERNRAHMAVVKDTAGEYRRHHFEVRADRTIRVWETWRQKGELIHEGRYGADTSTVEIRPPENPDAVIELHRD